MSGIEIVGVILGAIPVMVAALQQSQRQYDGTKQKWRNFRNMVQYIDRLIVSLECQKVMMTEDFLILIRAAAAPVLGQTFSINATNCNQLLNREDVKQRLQSHLGDNYDLVLKKLKHCETLLEDIAARISECTSGGLVSNK